SLVRARAARHSAPLRAALSRTDAVGEGALGFAGPSGNGWQRPIPGRRCCPPGVEDRLDRRVRPFERGGPPSILGGHLVDVLAQHGVFHALVLSGVCGVAFYRRDLALQLVTLVLGSFELGLDERLLRLDGRQGEAVAILHLSQRGANFRFGFLGGRRLVAPVLGEAFAIRQQSALFVAARAELLTAAAGSLRFRRLRGELAVELAGAAGQIVRAAALLGKLLVRRLELGGLGVEVIPQRLGLFLVAVDLAL